MRTRSVRVWVVLVAVLVVIAGFNSAGVASARHWPSNGSVSGRVTDSHGNPMSDVDVMVYSAGFRSGDDLHDVLEWAATDGDGHWSVELHDGWGLDQGAYLIRFSNWSHDFQATWYQRSSTPESATPVVFASGVEKPGINSVMIDTPRSQPPAEPGKIVGRVKGNGKYLSRIPVAAYAADQGENDWPVATTATNGTGRYTLSGLPAGVYRVKADGTDSGRPTRWFKGATSWAQATQVAVAAGMVKSGVRFSLPVKAATPTTPANPVIPKGTLKAPKQPKWVRHLPVDAIEGYQGQTKCRKSARKGTKALLQLIFDTYGSQEGAGLNRACQRDTSEHYDGRAIDWMVNSRIADQAKKGDSFTGWLTRPAGSELGVMARRLGVMYVIWRGRIWKQYQASAGWQTYMKCDRKKYLKPGWDNDCHRNHVHISLTFNGARMKTSWWSGRPLT